MSDWSPATGDPRSDALIREIFELRQQLRARFISLLEPMAFPPDLTMRQMHVLLTIANTDGLTMYEFGERFGISKPTATGLIDRLVDKGLVQKLRDPSDRRVRRLTLTDAGRDTLNQLDSAFSRVLGESISRLERDELTTLRDYASLLLEAAERVRDLSDSPPTG
jgi:DNA-binding MarR family transcriptional regulator